MTNKTIRDQFQDKIEACKDWDEALVFAKDFFRCPDDHEKRVMRLYKKAATPANIYGIDAKGITCQPCWEEAMQWDPQEMLDFFEYFLDKSKDIDANK